MRQPEQPEGIDDPLGRIKVVPLRSVAEVPGVGVVEVVIALAEADEGDEPAIAAAVLCAMRLGADHVAERIDREGGVQHHEHPEESAQQEGGDARRAPASAAEQGPTRGQHRDDHRAPIDLALLQTQVAGRKAAEPFERMGRAQHGQRRGQGEGGPPTGQKAIDIDHLETVLPRPERAVDLQKLQDDDQRDQRDQADHAPHRQPLFDLRQPPPGQQQRHRSHLQHWLKQLFDFSR